MQALIKININRFVEASAEQAIHRVLNDVQEQAIHRVLNGVQSQNEVFEAIGAIQGINEFNENE